jgi:hypothetical protein
VHVDDQAEVRHVHLGKALVAQNAGVVDQNVHAPPGRDGLLDHGLHGVEVGHGGRVGNRLAARRTDFIHHLLRRRGRAARAVHRAAQIVDHHLGAAPGQGQRMQTPQTAARSRHDGHTTLKIHCHDVLLLACALMQPL